MDKNDNNSHVVIWILSSRIKNFSINSHRTGPIEEELLDDQKAEENDEENLEDFENYFTELMSDEIEVENEEIEVENEEIEVENDEKELENGEIDAIKKSGD